MKQDRFLMAILAGITLLVVISLVLFFTRQRPAEVRSDDTPEGVVFNFIQALQSNDPSRAYQYLAEGTDKPNLTRFNQALLNNQSGLNAASMEVGDSTITGDRATVSVTIIRSGGPFSNLQRENNVAELARQGGAWKITSMPYPYWDYSWYQILKP